MATVTIEGELTVRLDCDPRRVRRVTVRSTRPFAAARVLAGRSPDDAVRMVPRLFSICAHAQGAAAAGATEAASGRSADPATRAARETSVRLEAIQEYLWRVLIDWPRVAGRGADVEAVAAVRRVIAPALARSAACALGADRTVPATERGDDDGIGNGAGDGASVGVGAELERLVERHVFGVAPAVWLALPDLDALVAWAERAGTLPAALVAELAARRPAVGASDVALMPEPRGEDLLAIAAAMQAQPAFERAPVWRGAPAETGALARLQAHPVVAAMRARHGNAVPARMVARLAELAQLVLRVAGRAQGGGEPRWVDALSLGASAGLGVVQTARGLLLHRASVDEGRVVAYRIVAPTEWNFHPAGALVRGLEGVDATDGDALVRDARLAVQALDPCVGCRVEVAHA